MQKQIGLFGGTFDPVHAGHLALAQSFLNSGFIDELWIILTPFPPHKKEFSPSNYSHRLDMLEYVFKSMAHVKILTIENELPRPSYTFKTIEFLASKHSKHRFYYCLGGDSLINFYTWKNPEIILKHVNLLVASRPGSIYDEVDNWILEKSEFIEHEPIDVSSTEIKTRIAGNNSIEGLVHPEVESYIRSNNLYLSN